MREKKKKPDEVRLFLRFFPSPAMTKDEDFNLLKIQTYILKVNIHCDGCKHKVKKLLQRIEGVYAVSIDAEQQQVTVSGSVDSPVLIKRLARSGKHAELWSSSKPTNIQTQKPNSQQNQKQQQPSQPQQKGGNKSNKDRGKEGLMQGLKALKNQQGKLAASLSSDEEDNCEDDDDDLDEDDLRFLSDKMNQFNLLKQATNAAAVKKNITGGNGAGGKKGGVNPNQNMAKNLMAKNLNEKAPKMGNVAGNPDGGEGKMNGLMGLGHHGLGGMNSIPANTGFPISSNGGRFVGGHQPPQPMMMNNMQGHQAAMMNNLQRGQMNNMMMHDSIRYMQPQTQMMYNRAPQISPYIGYHPYYQYPCPNLNYQSDTGDYGAHLFSDENTSGCVIM